MQNRAKCKLCNKIIISEHESDTVICACGHISVSGGQKFGCSAKDWANFIRVDDEGNEIVPEIKEPAKPTYEDLLQCLDDMINKIEGLPPQAMIVAINHYDFCSLLMLLSAIFRCDKEST